MYLISSKDEVSHNFMDGFGLLRIVLRSHAVNLDV